MQIFIPNIHLATMNTCINQYETAAITMINFTFAVLFFDFIKKHCLSKPTREKYFHRWMETCCCCDVIKYEFLIKTFIRLDVPILKEKFPGSLPLSFRNNFSLALYLLYEYVIHFFVFKLMLKFFENVSELVSGLE